MTRCSRAEPRRTVERHARRASALLAEAAGTRSGESRRRILEAAEGLFVRHGLERTSLDDVARGARVARGSLARHFASKELLLAGVAQQPSDRMPAALVAAVRHAPTHAAKVRAVVHTKRTSVARLAAQHHAGEDVALERLRFARFSREAVVARERALLRQVLREGDGCGGFALADPDRVASGILTCLDALATSVWLDWDKAEVLPGVDAFLAVLLRGLEHACRAETTERGRCIDERRAFLA